MDSRASPAKAVPQSRPIHPSSVLRPQPRGPAPSTLSPTAIILSYQDRSLITARPASLALALEKTKELFVEIRGDVFLEVCLEGVGALEVVDDAWDLDALGGDLRKFYVGVREGQKAKEKAKEKANHIEVQNQRGTGNHDGESQDDEVQNLLAQEDSGNVATAEDHRIVQLTIKFPGGYYCGDLTFACKRTTPLSKIYAAVAKFSQIDDFSFSLRLNGEDLLRTETPAMLEFENEEQIEFYAIQVGGKPVILFYPTSHLPSVNVSLSLVPEWKFSAVYPLTPISPSKNRITTVEWNVSASPDGTLIEKPTGISTSYLFWEALALSLPPSPRLRPNTIDPTLLPPPVFDPSRPLLDATNSVLLPFPEFIPYLHSTLLSLSLTISAATDFMTYWLPHFLEMEARGQSIAMRFVEQVAYEKAAILRITPEPEVVTRVFMVFKGVDRGEEKTGWLEAGEVDWVEVVGVRKEAWDEDKFRVLEWGGMEFKS